MNSATRSLILFLHLSIGAPITFCHAQAPEKAGAPDVVPYVMEVDGTMYGAHALQAGIGRNSLTGAITPLPCVTLSNKRILTWAMPANPSVAADSVLYKDVGDDFSSLARTERMSLSAEIGFAAFSASGLYRASASFNNAAFSRWMRVGSKVSFGSYVFAARGDKKTGEISKQDIVLTNQAKNLWKNNRRRFYEQCGDQFAYSIQWGANFAAVYTASNTDEEEAKLASSAINLAVAGFGGGGGEFLSFIAEARKHSDIEVHITHWGRNDPLPAENNFEEFARNLPKISAAESAPIGYGFVSYSYITDSKGANTLNAGAESLMRYLLQLEHRKAALEYVQQHPTNYGLFDSNRLTNEIQRLADASTQGRAVLERCVANERDSCADGHRIEIGAIPRPKHKVTLKLDRDFEEVKDVVSDPNFAFILVGSYTHQNHCGHASYYPPCNTVEPAGAAHHKFLIRSDSPPYTSREEGVLDRPCLAPAGTTILFAPHIGVTPGENVQNSPPLQVEVYSPIFRDDIGCAWTRP